MTEDLNSDKIYISEDQIRELNVTLARQINHDYEGILGPDEYVVVVVTLKGAMFFAADLVRHLNFPVRLDFVRLASYGAGKESSGTVRFVKDVEIPPQGKHLLVLDEIIDSGNTLKFLMGHLKASHPKSLKVGALLSKPSRREVEVKMDYIGREVEDRFLVGYGLDFDEKYRQLKDIYALD